jgi:hypothetical protein
MCELRVTVKLFTTVCSLCNSNSHFSPNQNKPCSCSLLNVCTTAQQYVGTNVRLSKERR